MADNYINIPKQFLFDSDTVQMLKDLAASQATSEGAVVRGLVRDEWNKRQTMRLNDAEYRRIMESAK
jgi:hypothetical protein